MTKGLISKQYDPSAENLRSGFLTGVPSWTASAMALILMLGALLIVPGCGSNGGGGGSATTVDGFPAVQIWIERAVVETGIPLLMFGQASDVDGGLVTYEWDFEDDGVFDLTGQNATAVYLVPGTFTVRLRVTDGEGNASEATATVMVFVPGGSPTFPSEGGSPDAPAVVIRAFTMHLNAVAEVTFCAEAEDPTGSPVVDFSFDFTDDGVFDQSSAFGTATNNYSSNGNFTCRVRVTDSLGATSDATVVIALCPEPYPGDPPSAMIVVPGGTLVTDLTTPIALKAIGSDIDGGATASIVWDLDDNLLFTDATGREVSALFPVAGQYRVKVRITDDEGSHVSEAEVTVVAEASPGGPGIAVHAFADAVHASTDTPINFHCRAENPGGGPVSISWDFDGDGVEDSTLADALFAFATPGVYIPRCIVSDAGGDTAVSDLVVVIENCGGSGGPDPGPYFLWDCLQEPTVYHGGAGNLQVGLGISFLGGDPQEYQILWKIGPIGALCPDPAGGKLIVSDTCGNVLPTSPLLGTSTPTPVCNTPAPSFSPVNISISGTVDGPPCIYCYTVGIRLTDPGVRSQVLKCVVCIIHDWLYGAVTAEDFGEGDIRFGFDVGLREEPLNSPAVAPPVYDLEIIFADQSVPWNFIDLVAATLPNGWVAQDLLGPLGEVIGVRFFTSTNPIVPGGPVLSFQNMFSGGFLNGDGDPELPQDIRLEMSDDEGNIIGKETLQISYE